MKIMILEQNIDMIDYLSNIYSNHEIYNIKNKNIQIDLLLCNSEVYNSSSIGNFGQYNNIIAYPDFPDTMFFGNVISFTIHPNREVFKLINNNTHFVDEYNMPYWITKENIPKSIKEMDDTHICNIIDMLYTPFNRKRITKRNNLNYEIWLSIFHEELRRRQTYGTRIQRTQ